jgi:hypothetical protein
MKSPVIEQVRKQVAPVAKTAGKASDEVFKRVLTVAHGVHYQPHPKRSKFITILKAALPAIVVGALLGRRRAPR